MPRCRACEDPEKHITGVLKTIPSGKENVSQVGKLTEPFSFCPRYDTINNSENKYIQKVTLLGLSLTEYLSQHLFFTRKTLKFKIELQNDGCNP